MVNLHGVTLAQNLAPLGNAGIRRLHALIHNGGLEIRTDHTSREGLSPAPDRRQVDKPLEILHAVCKPHRDIEQQFLIGGNAVSAAYFHALHIVARRGVVLQPILPYLIERIVYAPVEAAVSHEAVVVVGQVLHPMRTACDGAILRHILIPGRESADGQEIEVRGDVMVVVVDDACHAGVVVGFLVRLIHEINAAEAGTVLVLLNQLDDPALARLGQSQVVERIADRVEDIPLGAQVHHIVADLIAGGIVGARLLQKSDASLLHVVQARGNNIGIPEIGMVKGADAECSLRIVQHAHVAGGQVLAVIGVNQGIAKAAGRNAARIAVDLRHGRVIREETQGCFLRDVGNAAVCRSQGSGSIRIEPDVVLAKHEVIGTAHVR